MRHVARRGLVLSLGCALGAALACIACSSFDDAAACEGATCEGAGSPDGAVVAPPGCDLTKSPKDAPACVDDAVGVFVSAGGSDGATGTKAAPVKTIGKAVEVAGTRGLPRVYVCEGTYDGNVEVKSAVSIHGGLACGTWAYTGAKPKLAPPKGVALKITKVSGPVVVEDLEVVGSADANVPGDSAIAVFVSESGDVRFISSALASSGGTAGPKGATRSNYSGAATAGGFTNSAAPGAGPSCTCSNGTSSKGGAGASASGGGVQDGTASPSLGGPNSGASRASSCDPGLGGANGGVASAPEPTLSPGALSVTGWAAPKDSLPSGDGNPGQGGGGGGGRSTLNIGGGGGGCGGCGGAGGGPGGVGGVSVALLAFNSRVELQGGSARSGIGGAGGEGATGQAGQEGAAAGEGACNGGSGGAGAGGSGGGGGAGGHSAAIAFSGSEPKVTGTTLTPSLAGKGGSGGAGGKGPGNAGPDGKPGADGKSQPVLSL